MFWATARRTYSHVTTDDSDVQIFLKHSNEFQQDVYKGLAGRIQDAGHKWVSNQTKTTKGRVLEIGFGAGRHSRFFSGDPAKYFVTEYSGVHHDSQIWKNCRGRASRCDARQLPFKPGVFQVVISIYNLEHIANLQQVFSEVHRVLAPGGRFLVALPCEGGLAWNLGRELTTRRLFQKKYGINYDKVIAYEHIWSFDDIFYRLIESKLFVLGRRRFYPTLLPSVNLNLIGCIECIKPALSDANR